MPLTKTVPVLAPLLLMPLLAADPRDKIEQTFHVPNPLPALAIQHHGALQVEPGIVADRVTYNTQLNMRVPAIVYHPTNTSITPRLKRNNAIAAARAINAEGQSKRPPKPFGHST